MDINTLRGIATIFVMLAFIGICWWTFSPRRKQQCNEAANLPFADEQAADVKKTPAEDSSLHSADKK